jgi:uncharacterized protein (TIGR02302 family)
LRRAEDIDPTLQRAFQRAGVVLWWESVWPVIWPPLAVALTFLAIAMLGLPGWIGMLTGGWGQLALLVLFAGGFLLAVRHGLAAWAPHDRDRVIRRVERDSTVGHRPVSGLLDKPAGTPDPTTKAIWTAHRLKLLSQISRLRVAPPDPAMIRIDPWGVRVVIGLLVISGLMVSSGDRFGRIANAFDVTLAPLSASPPPTLDVWVNPPSYTGQAPLLLARAGTDAQPLLPAATADAATPHTQAEEVADGPTRIEVPVGSSLIAKVNGGDGPVTLALSGTNTTTGETIIPFEAIGPRAHQLEAVIDQGSALAIRQGDGESDVLANWVLTVIPDLKPSVSFAEDPVPTERGALSLHFNASDDYGVAEVSARIVLLNSLGEATSDAPTLLPLTLPRIGLEVVDAKDFHDLTPHPWAGQPVGLELIAKDEAGQEGISDRIRMILPERAFTHPVARAVIEQRKRLVTEPQEYTDISQILLGLASRPGRYFDDPVTFLGLKVAATRLVLNGSDLSDEGNETVPAVQSLLWDLALRIEDGELSLADRELRELERKIMDMLSQENVDEDALEQALDELKAAIDKMLQAMMEQMQQEMQNQDGGESQEQMQEVDPNRLVERQDLMDMIDRARELMKSGAKDAAREMLSKLREMMENLQAGRPQPMSPQQQAAQEMMRQLQDLAEQQRQLMDDTYKSHQDGSQRDGRQGQQQMNQQPGQQGMPQSLAEQLRQQLEQQFGRRPGQQGQQGQRGQQGQGQQGQGEQGQQMTSEQLAEMQEQLRRQLGEFMRKLAEGMGQIPDPLGQAERAMKDAGQALGEQQPGEAVGPQGDALEALQQGADAIRQQMQQMQQANGGTTPDPNARGQGNGEDQRDPLNRDDENPGFANDDGRIGVPEESDLQRARRIFDELRRRSGDQSRPELELDYIERLLKRF